MIQVEHTGEKGIGQTDSGIHLTTISQEVMKEHMHVSPV